MKNINEELKRMRVLMGLTENIQHNNYANMGISRKTISRGGVMYQEQDIPDVDVDMDEEPPTEFEREVEARKDAFEKDIMDYRQEVSDKIEDVESDEEKRQEEIQKQKDEAEEKKKAQEEEKELKKQEEKDKKEEEELRKKEELEARLAAQRERTT